MVIMLLVRILGEDWEIEAEGRAGDRGLKDNSRHKNLAWVDKMWG